MNKLLIAAAAVFFALAGFFGSGAQAAGFNVRLSAPQGFSNVEKAGCGGYRVFRKRVRRSAHRSVRRKVQVARKPAKSTVNVAKAEPKKTEETKQKVAALETENSSISTANEKVAEAQPEAAPKPEKVAAVKEVGCKKFFPSVGLTLSVSCE